MSTESNLDPEATRAELNGEIRRNLSLGVSYSGKN